MSVNFVSGDLTTIDHPAVIIQQVNCQNAMGAGLAKSLMTRWPQIASDYHAYCQGKQPENLLGHVQTSTVDDHLFVCNVFGQLRYGRHGHYTNEAKLLTACDVILRHAAKANLPVYAPVNLGSGLAGGDRNQIINGLTQSSNQYGAQLYLVDYSQQSL